LAAWFAGPLALVRAALVRWPWSAPRWSAGPGPRRAGPRGAVGCV